MVYPHETPPDDVPRGRGDNARTTSAPKISEGQKIPNFGAISDNFEFDREYLHNRSTHGTSVKKLDQPLPLPRLDKKMLNFGPQTKQF